MTSTTQAMRAPTSLLLGACMCCAIFASSTSAQTGRRTAALLSYGAAAVELEPAVRAALAELTTVALKDAASTAADVAAAAELGTTCEPKNEDCLASLAVLLHVDVLVVASAASAAEPCELVVVDAVLGRQTGRAQLSPADGAVNVAAAARDAVQLLLEPHLHFGTLVVRAPPASTITIDGAAAGIARADEARTLLRAGRHHVAVTQQGHAPFRLDVLVAAGAEVVVDAELRPHDATAAGIGDAPSSARSPVSGAWIMAGTGLGVAAIGGAVALGIDAGLGTGLGNAEEKQGYQAAGVIALVVASTGAAVAITGAAIALFMGD